MNPPSPYIAIAAGGTGGHILPGLRIGDAIERLSHGSIAVQYIAGARDIERTIYAAHGSQPLVLRSSHNPKRFRAIVRAGYLAADFASILARFIAHRPRAVLAMGGAVCFPVLAACRVLRIPYFLHESNAIPGKVIRLFARGAHRVFLGMGGFQGPNVSIVGTPSAETVTGEERNIVLCVGGSQGASALNHIFAQAAAQLAGEPWKFLLIAGPGKNVEKSSTLEVRDYVADMAPLLARTAIAVSRAGAGTLADLASYGIPSILVPYPHAADGHQTANARIHVGAGGAVMLEEKELTADILANTLRLMLQEGAHRSRMAEAMKSLHRPDAAGEIATGILAAAVNSVKAPHTAHASPQPSSPNPRQEIP